MLWVGGGFLYASSIPLAELTHYQGTVEKAALEGKSRKHFSLLLQNLPIQLTIFYADQDYGNLLASVVPGDTVTAYFVAPVSRNDLHTVAESVGNRMSCDIFQLTKRGEVLLSIANKHQKERWLGTLLIAASLGGIGWATWAFKRGKS